jgi:hypothetical protein
MEQALQARGPDDEEGVAAGGRAAAGVCRKGAALSAGAGLVIPTVRPAQRANTRYDSILDHPLAGADDGCHATKKQKKSTNGTANPNN